MTFKTAALGLITAAVLAACSGSDSEIIGATANLTANVTASNVAAFNGNTFSFASGVPALGTTAATTVAITAPTGGTPRFTAASGGNTASGELRFGSCIFVITSSTFPAGHPLALGATTTVATCSFTAAVAGRPADGSTTASTSTLVLGANTSNPVTITVSVSSNGTVTINNVTGGTVATGRVTGGG